MVSMSELIKGLVYNASVEFTAYNYFTNLGAYCTGMEVLLDKIRCSRQFI